MITKEEYMQLNSEEQLKNRAKTLYLINCYMVENEIDTADVTIEFHNMIKSIKGVSLDKLKENEKEFEKIWEKLKGE